MQALEELALSANNIENSIIMINGYADERGTSADNQRLSEGRVEAVELALRALGVKP